MSVRLNKRENIQFRYFLIFTLRLYILCKSVLILKLIVSDILRSYTLKNPLSKHSASFFYTHCVKEGLILENADYC